MWLRSMGGVELACKKQADEGMVWGVTWWGTGSPTSWGGRAVGDRRKMRICLENTATAGVSHVGPLPPHGQLRRAGRPGSLTRETEEGDPDDKDTFRSALELLSAEALATVPTFQSWSGPGPLLLWLSSLAKQRLQTRGPRDPNLALRLAVFSPSKNFLMKGQH